ncbi:trypsin-like serine protease [Alteromonas gilva]|uniref:Trypsin-like serine protease n=1 Tax=Alteromonas gilva TaxID=2987522 RepID=A0ABT5L2L1_9ALTE|nr:trypsin-like serine protease [Alteromonas gilva]MDC8830664.1 trypsin-like serine protease [Alteromonas gilva]
MIYIANDTYTITVGLPDDPRYANAGENLRNGVGAIFIGFGERGFSCTATAISKTHVLTAAHCVRDGENPLDTLLFVFSAGLEVPFIAEATGFVVHPYYDTFLPSYGAFAHGDMAVLELAQALPDSVEPYELYRGSDEFEKAVRHNGHGAFGTGNKGATGGSDFFYARTGLNMYESTMAPFLGDGFPDQLVMDFDSNGTKHNAMQWWFSSAFVNGNTDNPVVAQKKPHVKRDQSVFADRGYGKLEVGTARGDSGGPSFIDGKIAGVHSFGFTHGCDTYANGTDFTCGLDSSYGEMSGDARVSFYASW